MGSRGPKGFDREEVLPMIFAGVASGIALDNVLKGDGMPSASTFWRWHMEDEDIRDNLARARENGVEVHMDECLAIADETQVGETVTVKADGAIETKREDMIAHRRLRIDTRIKRAQMIAPRKYGPRVDVTTGGEPLRKLDDTGILTRLSSMVSQIRSRQDAPDDTE